ncbi:YadA-like family protein [Megasphaera sp.]|uniref:YadA C-terminal domain-containing protein n=1 Tax=Megasphaera sp. TaxID=2023260 RepID=UPI003F739D97
MAGKDGKDAVSIAGKDGVGHIGLTGPKGENGADGTPGRDGISIDITTDLKTATLDDGKNVKTVIKDKEGKETTITQAPRIQYESNGKNYEVATMDDGLKFVGNDGKEVTRKLNSTLSLTGGMDKDAVAKASSKNLGVRSNANGDGLEIVMTDTPDFTKVTVGEGNDPNSKITIGKQTVTGKKSDGTDGTAETGNYITGLDNTRWNKDNVVENRAATEGQLRDIAGSITNQNQGGGFALTSDEKGTDKIVKQDLGKAIQIKGDTTYKIDGTVEKAGNIKTSIDNGAIKVELNKDVDLTKDGSIKAGNTTINKDGVDTNKVIIKDSTISISKDGINAGGKQITDVASGASEIIKDADGKVSYKYDNEINAANIGDVKRIAGDMKTEINNNISNVTNKVDQIGQHVDNIQKDVTQLQQDVKADRTYQGDDGAAKKVKVKFGSFLSLTGGAKLADLTEEGNIGVVQKEIDNPDNKGEKITGLSVRLAKHLNLEKTTYTSNENGQTYTSEIDGKGLTIKTGDENRNITVQDGNVNMGGNQIHNVAPGQAPGDAVNVSQLNATNQTVANLGGAVNKLGTRVNRVGAGAAALAALHPLDFDPDDKWDFAAGYGNYKDASAVAVGAYYRPNEDTMFSVGGSFGGGENMVNAGVSFKVGQGNHVSTSRVAMAKEIKDLRQDVANLNAIVNRQSALIDKLTGTNAGTIQDTGNDLFPDVPANHWAYEYVTKLKQAGILTGYPDGNFDGDRMMTRYEFAAIVYRAIMAGAASNPALSQDGTLDKLAKEFSPEMKHIRIDTIAKDKDGNPTIERVRVIPEAKQ